MRKTSKSTQNDKAYEEFLLALELTNLSLKSCSASIDRDAFFDLFHRPKKIMRKLDDEYTVTTIEEEYFQAEGHFTMMVSGTSGQASPLKLECTYEVHMHGKAPIWKEGAERFTQSELRLILVPYARQFITSITGEMGVPPIVIPLASGRG